MSYSQTLRFFTATGDGVATRQTTAGFPMSANEYLVVAGHTWTLSMSSLEEFETRFGRNDGSMIAGSRHLPKFLMLAFLVWLIGTGRTRASRLAAAMTEELRHMAKHRRAD